MTSAQWFLLVGGLLLARGLTASFLTRLPVTPAIIYLAVGLLVGPTVLNLFHFNPLKESALLEVLTEVAVLISLFSAGVKMPVPFSFPRWRTPILLASLSMTISVGLVTAFAYYVLGSAFPFVMLGLGLLGLRDLGDFGLRWVLMDVVWATVAGIAIGVILGSALARLGWKLRNSPERHKLMDDFLGLGLIGLVYGLSVWVDAWGFLAVFFAAVALRQTELKLASENLSSINKLPIGEILPEVKSKAFDDELQSSVSGGALLFKEHLERLSEVMLVLLVGGTLFFDSWSWHAVILALFLFLVARPASVLISLYFTRTSWPIRGMVGWFGVRGIGSLYYLMYVIQHGLPEALALELIQFTLIVVTLSILIHGTSVKPLMKLFWLRRFRDK